MTPEVQTQPVVDGVFTVDPPRLLGARCGACGQTSFPRLDGCPYCGSESIEAVELADHGTLWGWTTVLHAPPGYLGAVPYGFGIVELPEGVRVVTRLAVPEDWWSFGQPMHLRTADVGVNSDRVVLTTWEFAP